jgi:hypothetical protein
MILYADNCNQPGVLGVTHALIPWRPRTHTVGANTVLGIMRYGSPPVAVPSGDWPVVSVALPTLGEEQRIEVWRSSTPVTMGREGNIDYASNGQVLFGVCEQQEIEDILLDTLAQESYVAIVQLLRNPVSPRNKTVSSVTGDSAGVATRHSPDSIRCSSTRYRPRRSSARSTRVSL